MTLNQTHSHHCPLHYSTITLDWMNCLFSNHFIKSLFSFVTLCHSFYCHFLKLTYIPPFWYLLSTHSSDNSFCFPVSLLFFPLPQWISHQTHSLILILGTSLLLSCLFIIPFIIITLLIVTNDIFNLIILHPSIMIKVLSPIPHLKCICLLIHQLVTHSPFDSEQISW